MTYVILSGLQVQLSEICLSFVFKGGDSGLRGGSLSEGAPRGRTALRTAVTSTMGWKNSAEGTTTTPGSKQSHQKTKNKSVYVI